MTTALVIALVVLGGSAGDVLITKGMKQVGEIKTVRPRELLRIAGRVLLNKLFIAGLACMAVSFFSFLAALRLSELSLVLPATSLSFVVTTAGAKLYLKERISGARLAGTLLVCLGVALLAFDELQRLR
jgi:drug/metabolite transporter (DMT)-like permease